MCVVVCEEEREEDVRKGREGRCVRGGLCVCEIPEDIRGGEDITGLDVCNSGR